MGHKKTMLALARCVFADCGLRIAYRALPLETVLFDDLSSVCRPEFQ